MRTICLVLIMLTIGACAGHSVNCSSGLQPINAPAAKSASTGAHR